MDFLSTTTAPPNFFELRETTVIVFLPGTKIKIHQNALKYLKMEQETTQVELVENRGEEEMVKCNEYMIDLEAGLLPHEGSGKSGTFKQCRDSFLGFIEELIIVIIIVLIFYSLTMAGLFYVMTMTKILF